VTRPGLLDARRALLAPTSALWRLTLLRAASAVIFISFGVGKFVNHASESASFRTYGLPVPGAFTLVIGVLELAGGALLLSGLATRPTAALLAADMAGAIVVSGLLHG
jgi:putative oxidoreductase